MLIDVFSPVPGRKTTSLAFTLLASSPRSNLIFLQDSLSNRKFHVDSGASVSVFPHHSSKPSSGSVFSNSVELRTTDGSSVQCAVTRESSLCFGSRRFSWSFQLAPVTVPILRADFLRHHHLLVDVAGHRVLDSLSAFGEVFLHPQNNQRSFMQLFLQPQAPFVIFSQSSQMFSPQMDSQLILQSMECTITYKLILALQCL